MPKIEIGHQQLEYEDKSQLEFLSAPSFWHERMKSARPLRLPYRSADDVQPKWRISAWLQPILGAGARDAKQVLLDAFVIYLAKITGERTLNIGWRTECTAAKRKDTESCIFTIPMVVRVSLDEPWNSVSEAIDNELVFLTQNCELATKFTPEYDSDSRIKMGLPWQVVISTKNESRSQIQDLRGYGEILTMHVDETGYFCFIFDESRLSSELVRQIENELRNLAIAYSSDSCREVPIFQLNVPSTMGVASASRELDSTEDKEVSGNVSRNINNEAPPPNPTSLVCCKPDGRPEGHVEVCLVNIWKKLLGLTRINRYDSFFRLGGDSEIALCMVDGIQAQGLKIDLRDVYKFPVLSDLARTVKVPSAPNMTVESLASETLELTPKMFPLMNLTQPDIDNIVSKVPGGRTNIQDIYGLTPMQEGILFHHTRSIEEDPYLTLRQISFPSYDQFHRYAIAFQSVIDRHDILRTSFFWERLSAPVQVVWRRALLSVTELSLELDGGAVSENLSRCSTSGWNRINLNEAPLIRFGITRESNGTWVLLCSIHHLIYDAKSTALIDAEIVSHMNGRETDLSAPVPFRNYISMIHKNMNQRSHIEFFTEMLADIDQPTLPFGLVDVYADGQLITNSKLKLAPELIGTLRHFSKTLNVSPAILTHIGWALVVSRTSQRTGVVFGTVLSGRTQEGSSRGIGMFINTLPVKIDVDETPVCICAQRTQNLLVQLLEHEDASLGLAQRCSRIANGIPLFNSLLNYRHFSLASDAGGIFAEFTVLQSETRTNYPLSLSVDDDGIDLTLKAQVSGIDPFRICLFMEKAFTSLTGVVDGSSQTPLCSIDVFPDTDRKLLLETWNRTEYSKPDSECIHRLFEQHVRRKPSTIALTYDEQNICYAELNADANRLANRLIELGVGPECLVGICVAVSPALMVGLLAILKAGGAYVPLDPIYPSQRLIAIVNDVPLNIVIADRIGFSKLSTHLSSTVIVIDPNSLFGKSNTNPVVPLLNPQNLAYVIYTSGSTGRPKGVMVEHRNLVRLFDATESCLYFNQDDVWCLTHSVAFDFAVWEIWGAWRHGGRLVLASRRNLQSPELLYQLIVEQSITVLNLTPSAFMAMVRQLTSATIPHHLRYIIFGGESLNPTMLRPLFHCKRKHFPKFVNLYGPTETTLYVTGKLLDEQNSEQCVSPIGKPLPDARIYLLDANEQLVPLGVDGEIYVGGAGVARGYLNCPDLSREHFIADPFSNAIDALMYKTGDLARYLMDGNLVFMGRSDAQMKIRGYRVEAAEVEACLRRHPVIRDAVIRAHGDEPNKHLVAYVAAEPQPNLVETLRVQLKTQLPEFMVPSAIVRLDTIPLTHNGKVDSRALPAPDENAFVREAYEPPQGIIETTLATIWGELFNLQNVSRHDSFFALGGHSLLAVRMIERMHCSGFRLHIDKLFTYPVLSQLARTIEDGSIDIIPGHPISLGTTILMPDMFPLVNLTQTDLDRIVHEVSGGISNIQDIYSLSPPQEGILFHHVMAKSTDPYILVASTTFENRLMVDRYIWAVQKVIDRHDIMRTIFFWQKLSTPVQVVLRRARIHVTELTLSPERGSSFDQLKRQCDTSVFSIDLHQAPLMRFIISQDTDGSWVLFRVLHHLIGDHMMLEVMYNEIQAHLDGQEGVLATPTPFRNLIAHTRLAINQEELARFFTEMLADIDQPTLSFGIADIYQDGSQVVAAHWSVPRKLNDQLRLQARNYGVSVATLCHLAWASVVSRISGQKSVIFGTVLFGRLSSGKEFESAMGLFINTLPIRFDVDDQAIGNGVIAMHTRLSLLLKHEHASPVFVHRCSGIANGTPLFNTILNYRHNSSAMKKNVTVDNPAYQVVIERSNFPLALSVNNDSLDLSLTCHAVEPINSSSICAYMHQAMESSTECLQSSSKVSIRSIGVVPRNERMLVLETWNRGIQSHPDLVCIHQQFEQQVARNPTAIALIYEYQVFTFIEINAWANRLAHRIIELGVAPENLVGICVSVSPALLVGVLAILKAGGAYVPLDPAHPSERLIAIMNDASVNVVILDEIGFDKLSARLSPTVIVIDPNTSLAQRDTNPVVPSLIPRNLAYVIYTSGSTGKPKGVMVEHRNLVRLFDATESWLQFDHNDVWCMVHSLAFDLSVWEIWGAWRYGGQLVLCSRDVTRSPDVMYQSLCNRNITVLNLTPSAFQVIRTIFTDKPIPHHLRYVIFAGEALNPTILEPFFGTNESAMPQLFNLYGPTEITMHVTVKRLGKSDVMQPANPIGKPLPDAKIYLLDTDGQPVPIGIVGEVYVGGAGVARGYLNRPELTRDYFTADPFSGELAAKMYKTGDLARYLPDGNLIFMGRSDQQIKIRGCRVEPGEIEACLLTYPTVRQAVVILRGDAENISLVAYVVAEIRDDLASSLRTHLISRLPDYMIPSKFVRMDTLPLSLNGKLDHTALPVPDDGARPRETYEAPKNDIEQIVATIWAQMLGIERVSRFDNFFASGGDSLIAFRMINLAIDRGLICTLNDLFQSPILSDFAAKITTDTLN